MNPLSIFGSSKSSTPSISFIFIALFTLVIGVFVVSNSDTILSSMGFKTKTVMAGEISTLKADISRMADTNASLLQELEEHKRIAKETQEELDRLSKSKTEVVVAVAEIKTGRDKVFSPIVASLKGSQGSPKLNDTQTTESLNKVSVAVIDSLHAAYDKTTSSSTVTSLQEVNDESTEAQYVLAMLTIPVDSDLSLTQEYNHA